MVDPQQPELRRRDRRATTDEVPPGSAPGHHPEHEQDKPDGRDFAAKTHALAQEDAYEAPTPENEVLDLTQIDADKVHTGADPSKPDDRADRLATLAGKPFGIVGHALNAVRDRLPGN